MAILIESVFMTKRRRLIVADEQCHADLSPSRCRTLRQHRFQAVNTYKATYVPYIYFLSRFFFSLNPHHPTSFEFHRHWQALVRRTLSAHPIPADPETSPEVYVTSDVITI